jgi:hypothetical protein
VKRGGHLNLHVQLWKECEAAGLAAEVKECELQQHQTAGQFKEVKGDVLSQGGCELKAAFGCVIKFPQANEATGKNFQLGNTELENVTEGQLDKANVTGITAIVTNCIGIESGEHTNAIEKIPKILMKGAKAV